MIQIKIFENEFMHQENPDQKFWTFYYRIKKTRRNNYSIGNPKKLKKNE